MESFFSKEEEWLSIIEKTRELINSDESFEEQSVKDKILSFYYYYLDIIADHRHFISRQLLDKPNPVKLHFQMSDYRSSFERLFEPMVDEAIKERLIKGILILSPAYRKFFWLQHLFILRFWVTDESMDQDNTVALVEKSQKSTFDFMGNLEWKSSIDFWKFVIQNPIKFKWKYE